MIATQSMESLVANFSGTIRRERVNGREYIVAPITMIVPGVLQGSRGALLYPASEVANTASRWNGTVLTDGHLPDGMNGTSSTVRELYGMGFIQNSRFENGKLRADGWFDVEKTKRINNGIYQALLQNRKIEVSTGLGVDYENQSGVFNGRRFDYVVSNYRPDHLAILLNYRGACSCNDGCGVHNTDQHSPAGGSLNVPKIDWGTLATGSPTITSRSTGGGLPSTEIVWDEQPEPERAQPTVSRDCKDGPAGGSLTPVTPTY